MSGRSKHSEHSLDQPVVRGMNSTTLTSIAKLSISNHAVQRQRLVSVGDREI